MSVLSLILHFTLIDSPKKLSNYQKMIQIDESTEETPPNQEHVGSENSITLVT